jgi:Zn-dependent peptidase ImmA (M78 family)/DNA-binding XRE family transcriptional regulator
MNEIIKEIFGQRLLNARRQAGLSQDQLVELIRERVKKTAIAKYERGEMMPETEVIETLAKALNKSIDYFFRPFTVIVSDVAFRAKSSLGSKKAESLKNIIVSKIERYLELEKLLNMNSGFENPLKGIFIRTPEDVEKAAVKLAAAWNLGSEGMWNVIGMLEDNGIKVIEIDADEDFDGYSAYTNIVIPVIVLRGKGSTTERKRLTALHETAHLLLRFEEGLADVEKERYCHRFAGAILMPSATLYRELGKFRSLITQRELGLLKDKYGISAKAIVVRAYQLNIISKYLYIKLLSEINADKYERHIGSNNSHERSIRFEMLLSRALSEGLISHNKAAELAGLTLDELINNLKTND